MGSADAWDPLAGGLGLAALTVAVIGGALAVRRWWAIPLVLVMAPPLVILTRAPEPALQIAIAVPFLMVAGMLLSGLTLWLSASAARRGHVVVPEAGAALLTLAVATTLVGVYLDHRVVDHHPDNARLVDLAHGAYRGVRIGMSASELPGTVGGRRPRTAPVDEASASEGDSGPSSPPSGRELEFGDFVVTVAHGRVRALATTDRGAQTRAGVGNGDSLALARRRYPGISCDGVTIGSDSTNASYPACSGRLPNGLEVYFGGDPIDDVWLSTKGQLLASGRIRLPRPRLRVSP